MTCGKKNTTQHSSDGHLDGEIDFKICSSLQSHGKTIVKHFDGSQIYIQNAYHFHYSLYTPVKLIPLIHPLQPNL